MELGIILTMMILMIGLTCYQIYTDYYNRSKMFELQIQMAAGQQMMQKDLSWEDLKKIINDIISFIVVSFITNNGLMALSKEELSLSWIGIINELCTKVDMSISPEIKRQAYKSITEEYFVKFIKDSVQITVVYNLEKNRSNKVNNRLAEIQSFIRGSNTEKKKVKVEED